MRHKSQLAAHWHKIQSYIPMPIHPCSSSCNIHRTAGTDKTTQRICAVRLRCQEHGTPSTAWWTIRHRRRWMWIVRGDESDTPSRTPPRMYPPCRVHIVSGSKTVLDTQTQCCTPVTRNNVITSISSSNINDLSGSMMTMIMHGVTQVGWQLEESMQRSRVG